MILPVKVARMMSIALKRVVGGEQDCFLPVLINQFLQKCHHFRLAFAFAFIQLFFFVVRI